MDLTAPNPSPEFSQQLWKDLCRNPHRASPLPLSCRRCKSEEHKDLFIFSFSDVPGRKPGMKGTGGLRGEKKEK